jgi:hypothetical protein
MVRTILAARTLVALAVAACVRPMAAPCLCGATDDLFLALIRLQRPRGYGVLTCGYATLSFTTPLMAASLLTSVLTSVAYRYPSATHARALPPYPPPEDRPAGSLVSSN